MPDENPLWSVADATRAEHFDIHLQSLQKNVKRAGLLYCTPHTTYFHAFHFSPSFSLTLVCAEMHLHPKLLETSIFYCFLYLSTFRASYCFELLLKAHQIALLFHYQQKNWSEQQVSGHHLIPSLLFESQLLNMDSFDPAISFDSVVAGGVGQQSTTMSLRSQWPYSLK